jgi:hypothetical protein
MSFGPFLVKSKLGQQQIYSHEDALRYIRTLGKRSVPHWRVAERMLEIAWMSFDDEVAAEYAFRAALLADDALME